MSRWTGISAQDAVFALRSVQHKSMSGKKLLSIQPPKRNRFLPRRPNAYVVTNVKNNVQSKRYE